MVSGGVLQITNTAMVTGTRSDGAGIFGLNVVGSNIIAGSAINGTNFVAWDSGSQQYSAQIMSTGAVATLSFSGNALAGGSTGNLTLGGLGAGDWNFTANAGIDSVAAGSFVGGGWTVTNIPGGNITSAVSQSTS